MLGDDTGDNISEKRMSFCELTVQYWAWKNVEADYYGICHYRRFLGFSENKFAVDKQEIVHEECMGISSVDRHSLNNEKIMRKEISEVDAIVSNDFDLTQYYPYPNPKRDVFLYWKECAHLIQYSSFELLLNTLKELYPEYYEFALKYLRGKRFLGYNCFILKKELFFDLCKFEFDILFELEHKIDTSLYTERMCRTIGYLSEILYSIWVYKNLVCGTFKYKEKQLIMFDSTQKQTLYPKFGKETIPVVVMSSNYYAAFSSVFLKSIINQVKSSFRKYEIIYLHREIDEYTQKMLEKMVEEVPNVKISFLHPDIIIDMKRLHVSSAFYAAEAYYRLFSPWILKHYSKAIVLDIDLIVKSDLAELYDTDLNGKLAAGVKDILWQGIIKSNPQMMTYCTDELQLRDPYSYINTGVLLLNLDAIRKEISLEEVAEMAKTKKYFYQEQDIFNVLFEGKIRFVDITWNYYVMSSLDTIQGLQGAPHEIYNTYINKKDEVKILHYAAQPKPWFSPETYRSDEFWKIARETNFYEILLGRLMESKSGPLYPAVYDLQIRAGVFDSRTPIRKFADKILPPNTRRRTYAKLLLPKGSLRWRFCKRIYYIFKPQYRPDK